MRGGGPLESMRPTRKLRMVGYLDVRVKVASASCLLTDEVSRPAARSSTLSTLFPMFSDQN